MAASTTSQVYIQVIDDVVNKVRDEFVNNGGPDDEVLKELQSVILTLLFLLITVHLILFYFPALFFHIYVINEFLGKLKFLSKLGPRSEHLRAFCLVYEFFFLQSFVLYYKFSYD